MRARVEDELADSLNRERWPAGGLNWERREQGGGSAPLEEVESFVGA